jgi:glycolate oxidase FAD binding subunit
MFDSATLAAMRRIARAVDPFELANRGKMFPDTERPGSDRAVDDAIRALQDAVREHPRVLPRGSGSKPALSTPPEGVVPLVVSGLRGIVEYDPEELTITALAGTPVRVVQAELAAHGQHLPFDPPLARAGATLGGVVAAGTSGPGSHRHSGVRDFVIGARFVDGTGALVGAGGRVVKNAAGFDLPRLMVGSLGRLGVLVELAFKVFPAPPAWGTLAAEAPDLGAALEAMRRALAAGLDLEAFDLEPPGRLLIRLGGPSTSLEPRLERLRRALGLPAEKLLGEDDAELWDEARKLAWAPPGTAIVRLALSPRRVAAIEPALDGVARRYSRAGAAGWLAWPPDRPLEELDALLRVAGAGGVRLTGPPGAVLLGATGGGAFADRVRRALDPDGRFAGSARRFVPLRQEAVA